MWEIFGLGLCDQWVSKDFSKAPRTPHNIYRFSAIQEWLAGFPARRFSNIGKQWPWDSNQGVKNTSSSTAHFQAWRLTLLRPCPRYERFFVGQQDNPFDMLLRNWFQRLPQLLRLQVISTRSYGFRNSQRSVSWLRLFRKNGLGKLGSQLPAIPTDPGSGQRDDEQWASSRPRLTLAESCSLLTPYAALDWAIPAPLLARSDHRPSWQDWFFLSFSQFQSATFRILYFVFCVHISFCFIRVPLIFG